MTGAGKTPSAEQAVRLLREAFRAQSTSTPADISVLTVALSAGLRAGQLGHFVREALDSSLVPALWRNGRRVLESLCLHGQSEALLDLLDHADSDVHLAVWMTVESHADPRLAPAFQVRAASEAAYPVRAQSATQQLVRRSGPNRTRQTGLLSPDLVAVTDALLAETGELQHVPLLFSLLSNQDLVLAKLAAQALHSIGPAATDSVLEHWSGHGPLPDALLWLLGASRNPLGAALVGKHYPPGALSDPAFHALVAIGGSPAIAAYVDSIETRQPRELPEPWKRDPATVDALLNAFNERPAFGVRGPLPDSLLFTLGGSRDPRSAALILDRYGPAGLTETAFRALVRSCGSSAVPAFIDTTEAGGQLELPAQWREDSIVADMLLRAFEDRPAFRRRGAAIIAKAAGARAAPVLIAALRDPYRNIRNEAESALRKLGNSIAADIVPVLGDATPSVRLAGLRVLYEIGLPAQAEPVARVLANGAEPERSLAAPLLARIAGAQAVPVLSQAWPMLTSETKRTVINILQFSTEEVVVEAVLALAIRDQNRDIRVEAARAIERWPSHGSVPLDVVLKPLLPLLGQSDELTPKVIVSAWVRRPHAERARIDQLLRESATPEQYSHLDVLREMHEELQEREAEFARRRLDELESLSLSLGSGVTGVFESPPELQETELPAPVTDHVWFSAVSPEVVVSGDPFILEIWAHLAADRSALEARDPFKRWSREKGPAVVPRGACLAVTVAIDAFGVRGVRDIMHWLGTKGNASFGIDVPSTVSPGSYLGSAVVELEHLRLTTLHFIVQVGRRTSDVRVDITGRDERVRTAFASYASQDREQVLARVQGMQAILPDLEVFLDVVSLRSGERWRERILEEVSSRDAFYLFWSKHASESTWVDYEWRAAVDVRGSAFIDPIPLESLPPPPELSHLHFGHWTLALGAHLRSGGGGTPEIK